MKKHSRLWTFALATALLFGQLYAEDAPAQQTSKNMYFNSGFELGDAGFGCTRSLRPDTNPELKYEKPRIDTTTSASGKQSMLIPNPFVEETMFYAREFEWELGKEYTFSVWLKSTAENYPVHVWLCTKVWGGAHGHFRVGKEWKRYSFTFKAPTDPRGKFFHTSIWFGQKKETDLPPADLWLDDFQLTPGKGTKEYAPCNKIELSAKAEKLNYLKNGKCEVNVECVAINNSDKAYYGTATLAVINDYTKKQVAAPKVKLNLPPHEKKTVTCKLPMNKYGSYRIKPKVNEEKNFAGNDGYFAVIGKYVSKPIDLDEDFCVGINFAGGATSDRRIRFGQQTIGGDVYEEYIKMFAEMGCRIIRDHDGAKTAYKWREIEPEEGRFDFTWSDQMTDVCLKYGIHPLPVLQGSYKSFDPASKKHPHHYHFGWLAEKGKIVPKYSACNHNRSSSSISNRINGPENLWRRYVKAVAERYKGRITHYEIFNEPNLYISPEDYMVYVKSASEEIRAADPNAKIVGFCSTGDLAGAGKSAEYLEPCFKQGGLKDADIVSFHPYDSRQLSSKRPSDEMIATYRKLVEKYGGKNPLWNTELYYLSDQSGNGKYPKAHHAATRFLIDLGENVKQSTCPPGYRPMLKTILLEKSFGYATRHAVESLPAPTYVVYNALARLFESCKPVEKLRWPVDCICYVSEREDGMRAAFWKYGKLDKLRVRLPFTANEATLYDMFGNELPIDKAVELETDPYYVVLKKNSKLSKAEFIKRLRSPALESDTAAMIELRRMLPTMDGALALVDVFNCTPDTLEGNAQIKISGIESLPTNFTLVAYESKTVRIPLDAIGKKLGDKVTVAIKAGEQSFEKEFRPPQLYTMENGAGPVEHLRKRGRGWHIKPKVSATFNASYDEEFFRVHVNVKDATPAGDTPEKPARAWQQDSVEFFIDTRPENLEGSLKKVTQYNPRVGKFGVLPHAEAARRIDMGTSPSDLPLFTAENFDVKVKVTDGGYTIDLAIPWKVLDIKPQPGTMLGLDIGVNDSEDGKSAPTQATWSSWGGHYKNRRSLGVVIIK